MIEYSANPYPTLQFFLPSVSHPVYLQSGNAKIGKLSRSSHHQTGFQPYSYSIPEALVIKYLLTIASPPIYYL